MTQVQCEVPLKEEVAAGGIKRPLFLSGQSKTFGLGRWEGREVTRWASH